MSERDGSRYLDTATGALQDHCSRGVQDRWEHDSHVAVPFQPGVLFAHVLDPTMRERWTSPAPALFYLALVRAFGKIRVERALSTATGVPAT